MKSFETETIETGFNFTMKLFHHMKPLKPV